MGIRTVVGLVLVGLAAPAAATEEKSVPLSTLVSGDQVRLRLADSRKTIRATIESVTDDEMVVRPPNSVEPLRFSPMQLQSLEVTRGRHSHWRKGALIGLVPGAVLMGAAFGTGIDCYRDCTFDPKVGVMPACSAASSQAPQAHWSVWPSSPTAGSAWKSGSPGST